MSISNDEHQHSRRGRLARDAAVAELQQQALRRFNFHGAHLRTLGGEPGYHSRHVDGIRFGFLSDAGVFARTVRGRAGRKLF